MVQLSHRRGWRIAALTTTLVTGLAGASAAPAAAHHGSYDRPQVVASGLHNPRHVRWSHGALYVAEAGVGGTGACVTSPEGGSACYGATGSITKVTRYHQTRVVKGLPSIASQVPADGAPARANAIGPSDIIVRGHHFTVSLGLGADPALRAPLNANGRKLGTVVKGHFGHRGLRVVADIGAYEGDANPDGTTEDTNPVALLRRGGRTYVVDAGGNDLVRIGRRGGVHKVAVFGPSDAPAPPFLGLPPGTMIPAQAVPTAAAVGPDGAIYVSQLTGFPFPVGGASIWRVVPGHAPTRYATGLTNVTDLAFGHGGTLYAVQIADQGLLAPHPTGSLVRIPAGGGATHTTVVSGLESPYGLALHERSAYVTTCSTCPSGGKVLRVALRHHS